MSKLLQGENMGVETMLAAEDINAQVEEFKNDNEPNIDSTDDDFTDTDTTENPLFNENAESDNIDELIEELTDEDENKKDEQGTETLIGGTSSMATMDININNLSATSYL